MARWRASAKWAAGPALDGQCATLLGLALSEGLGISWRGMLAKVDLHAWDSASRSAPLQEQSRYSASAGSAKNLAWRFAPCSLGNATNFIGSFPASVRDAEVCWLTSLLWRARTALQKSAAASHCRLRRLRDVVGLAGNAGPDRNQAADFLGLTGQFWSRQRAVRTFAASPRLMASQLTPTGALSAGEARCGFADA